MATTAVDDPLIAPAPDLDGIGDGATREPLTSRFWFLPALALVVLAVLVGAGNTKFLLIGMGLFTVLVVLNNVAPIPTIDPVELSSTVLLAIIIAVPFNTLPHNRATAYLTVVGLVAIGLSAVARKPVERPSRGRLIVLAMFAILAISSQLAPDAGGVKRLAFIASGAVPAYFLGVRLDNARLRTVAKVLVALGSAEALLAIAEPFVFPKHLWISAPTEVAGATQALQNSFLSSYERSQGTLGHPLALGVVLVVALGLLIRVLADLKLWQRLSLGAVLLGGLLFTGDRSCLIAAFIILVFGKRFSAARALVLLAAAASAVLLLVDVGALKGAVVTDFASSGSFGHRAAAYGLIWKLFITQPAAAAFGGDGFGSTQRLFDHGQLQTDGFDVVDNQFVLIQSQGGVICLFLFLALAILGIVCARRSLRPVIIFVVAISAIFDWLSWPSASALVFLLLGAGLAYAKTAAPAPAPAWPPNLDLPLDNRQPALH